MGSYMIRFYGRKGKLENVYRREAHQLKKLLLPIAFGINIQILNIAFKSLQGARDGSLLNLIS